MRTQPLGAARRSADVRANDGAFDVIELIDESVGDFDLAAADEGNDVRPTDATRRPVPWQAMAAVAAVAVAAVVLLRPWDTSPAWRTYPVTVEQPAGPSLWVLADPPAPLMSTETASTDPVVPVLGELFAAEGATYDSGRWTLFTVASVPAPADWAVPATDPRGAEVRDAGSGRRVLEWWPQPDQRWTVTASGFTDDEMRTFAAAVGVQDGKAALRTGYELDDLQPLASASGFRTAKELLDSLGQAPPAASVSIARYRAVSTPTTVATNTGPADAVAASQFLLGGRAAMVGDSEATVATSASIGTVVVWWEGGRLVVVTGPRSETQTVQAARGVRPADPRTDTIQGAVDMLVVGSGITADDHTWTATVHFGRVTRFCAIIDDDLNAQQCTADAHATLLSIAYMKTTIGTVVVALSNRDDPGEVRLTTASGTTSLRRLSPLRWDVSAVALLVQPGEAYAVVTSAEATNDRLQPPPEPTGRYVIDDPLLTPYSADITTPLDSNASYQLWAAPSGDQWLALQAAHGDPPSPLAVDAQRRRVSGLDLITPNSDPSETQVVVTSGDWYVEITGHEVDDATLIATADTVSVVEGALRLANPSGMNQVVVGRWENELLYGAVESESRSLTADGEMIVLRVGLETDSDRTQAVPIILDKFVMEPMGWAGVDSGALRGTGESVVTWVEADRILTLTGRVPVERLLELRGSVRPAIEDEWRDLLEGLRPDFQLGSYSTNGTGEGWEAGLQLAERAGRSEYLWWWTVPGTDGFTDSIEVLDDPAAGPVVDTIVVPGATYVFVTIPMNIDPRQVVLLADGVPIALSFNRPLSMPFLAAVARVDAGDVRVLIGDLDITGGSQTA